MHAMVGRVVIAGALEFIADCNLEFGASDVF
jgi:hypothetical protein